MELLNDAFGWDFDPESTPNLNSKDERETNRRQTYSSAYDFTEDDIEFIKRQCSLDLELYEFAKSLFLKQYENYQWRQTHKARVINRWKSHHKET